MAVSIKFFASIREQVGRSSQSWEMSAPITVSMLWDTVTKQPRPENLIVAINMEYVNWQTPVTDGDEVAFFPPVTGG